MSINLDENWSSPLNNRRHSLDLLPIQRSKRRFSFGKRNAAPSASSLGNPKTVALKTSCLLNGRPTSVAAALLGSWKEENVLGSIVEREFSPPAFTKSKQSLLTQELSLNDSYVTLTPLDESAPRTPTVSRENSLKRNATYLGSPLPKKSVIRSVKMAASASTTRLMSSPVVRRFRRSSSHSISPMRRKSVQITGQYYMSKNITEMDSENYVMLTGINKSSSPVPAYRNTPCVAGKCARSSLPLEKSHEVYVFPDRKSFSMRSQRKPSPARLKHHRASLSPVIKRQSSLSSFSSSVSIHSKWKSSTLTRIKKKRSSSPRRKSLQPIQKQDMSFRDVLDHKELLGKFREFLEKEFSVENLDFWLECQSYRTSKPSRQCKLAPKIYNRYLKPLSPKEINIDAKTRACVLSRIAEPNENTFQSAEEHVYKLMQTDPFPRFISARLKENKDIVFSTVMAVV